MAQQHDQQISDALAGLERSLEKLYPTKPVPAYKRFPAFKWVRYPILAVTLFLLPFFLLIRGSTFFYLHQGVNGWLSLGIAMMLSIIMLTLYAAGIEYRLTGRLRFRGFVFKTITASIAGFCLVGLFYVSSLHTKDETVRSSYIQLHPILRVTLATISLADNQLLITDVSRKPDDYRRWGLPVYRGSLHYPQNDGYVHAADLRTIGRPAWKNKTLEWSLRLLGFDTLRHTGTADHLHISIPVPSP